MDLVPGKYISRLISLKPTPLNNPKRAADISHGILGFSPARRRGPAEGGEGRGGVGGDSSYFIIQSGRAAAESPAVPGGAAELDAAVFPETGAAPRPTTARPPPVAAKSPSRGGRSGRGAPCAAIKLGSGEFCARLTADSSAAGARTRRECRLSASHYCAYRASIEKPDSRVRRAAFEGKRENGIVPKLCSLMCITRGHISQGPRSVPPAPLAPLARERPRVHLTPGSCSSRTRGHRRRSSCASSDLSFRNFR
ncbi:hypothetical protein EVAR_66068_1 [Eumeta japonica]|uniref:Uncharacterized protein n=1 Tax=Eumeta variegata TaxID=151549 RepID=A0A4C1ZZD1_EUMVA|nr:hypothetical protein EVAR_66068_1 [Eumeta japonica]